MKYCMRKERSLTVNTVLNVIRMSLSVVFPLITYPYAVHVLGVESIGKVTYVASIVNYFSFLAMLGVKTYGIREGAKEKNNPEKLNRFVREVFTINIMMTGVAYVLLIIAVCFVTRLQDYKSLFIIQSFSILFTVLGVDWLNNVFEDFLFITVRSILAHVLTLVILLLFVHKPEDYYLYSILSVVPVGITCFSNWFYCRKYVKPGLTRHINMKRHIKPLLILFAGEITTLIYINIDTTMLGFIKGDYYVGVYDIAVKIYTVMKRVMASIYLAVVPRLAFYVGCDKFDDYKKIVSKLCGYLTIILIPLGVGMMCLSSELMYFMGGKKLLSENFSLGILSIALIFAIFGGLVTAGINITLGRERDNLIAASISAGLNLGLNFIFIPLFAHNGAAITTLLSELFVMIFCFCRLPNKSVILDVQSIKISLQHALTGSFCIVIIAILLKQVIGYEILRMIVTVPISVIIYGLILLLLKDECLLQMVEKFKKKLKV